MKRSSFLLVGILILITNVYSQDAIIEDKNSVVSKESENTTPEFSLRNSIFTPNISSYYSPSDSIPTNMGEIYNRGLKLFLNGDNKKAYKHFEKIIKDKTQDSKLVEHAYYQLAHYDWYNCFDPYYNGIPSNIKRETNTQFTSQKKQYSFSAANLKSCLLMSGNPELATYNLRLVVERGSRLFLSDYIDDRSFAISIFETACQSTISNNISLYEIFYNRFYKKYENQKYRGYDCLDGKKLIYIIQLCETLPYISRMKQDIPISDIGKTAIELYNIAEKSYNENNYVKSFYYYVRAALYGDANSLLKIYEASNAHSKYVYNLPELKKSRSVFSETHVSYYTATNLAKEIYNCTEFEKFRLITGPIYDQVVSEFNAYKEQVKRREYAKEAEKERKKERRRQFWSSILQGTMQTMASVTNSMTYQQIPTTSNLSYTNSLLDPRLAMAQVNAQDYARYKSARDEFQRMGKDLSVEEWRAMEGQAIMNLKGQGYDPIAEQKKINEQQKTDFAEQRKNDKKAWFAKYGYDTSSESSRDAEKTLTTDNTSLISSGTKSSNSNIIATENIDSKEQYKSNEVSSDDYHFEKHVTLYIRDANSNRIMFSNKDLCKKGAKYYVKIDNKYYLVNTQGGWGFNSSIIYSNTKLYFDK